MTEFDENDDGLDAGSEPAALGAAPTLPHRKQPRRPPSGRQGQRPARRERAARAPIPAGPHGGSTRRYSGVVYVFEPNAKSLPRLGPYLVALWARRRFMHEMAKSGVNQNQANTALGRLWGIIDPLFQAGVYYLLYTIIRSGSRPIGFLPILIANIQLFGLTTSAMSEGGNSIRGSKALLLNSTFPRAMLPLTSVYKSLLRFGPAALVYVFIFLAMKGPIGWVLLLLPVLFAIQVVLDVGLALFTATLIVFFRDTRNVLNYVNRLLFFATPVIYPLDVLPASIRSFLGWQPVFALFACYQQVLGGQTPSLALIGQAAAWALAFFAAGMWIFLRHERDFAGKII